MRKLLLVLAGSLCIIATCHADLGAITVNSFLNQRLNATIPITSFGSNVDYTNLAINLAGKDVFNQSGINFNPELASLNFTITKTSRGHVLKISSSHLIKSPILSFILHYQINNNDFYRQYTVLLDPLEYSSDNSGVINSEPNKKNRVFVVSNNDLQNQNVTRTAPVIKPKASVKTDTSTSILSYDIDLNNNYVRQHLSQFNQDAFSYTTAKNDTIYSVAKFEQSLYHQANLSINQVIIALGLENYRDLYPTTYVYKSGVSIFLPQAKDIALIPHDLADNYLLNVNLTSQQKITLLTQIAAKFDPSLEIDSPDLFKKTESIINPIKQEKPVQMKQIKTEPKPLAGSILEQIFDYKYYILLGLLGLGLIILILRARADIYSIDTADTTTPENSDFTIDNIIHHTHLQASNHEHTPHQAAAKNLPDLEINLPTSPPIANTAKTVNSDDSELVDLLEQILSFDNCRDDIRLKLLELHLANKNISKATIIYNTLNDTLDSDDQLRKTLTEIINRYSYLPETSPEEPSSLTTAATTKADYANFDEPSIDSVEPVDSAALEKGVSFDSEYTSASSDKFISTDLVNSNETEYEDKLNLSRMYYYIDEHQKSRELLLEMKQDTMLPDKFKTQVNQLLGI